MKSEFFPNLIIILKMYILPISGYEVELNSLLYPLKHFFDQPLGGKTELSFYFLYKQYSKKITAVEKGNQGESNPM